MPGTAKPIVSYDYDPSRTPYHSHSTNLPHLSSWIEDLVRISEKSIPLQSTPSTETLVQALQRYDACFKELHSQTILFSDDLSKLYSKMWIGVLRLMDTMIKVYHRYVKQTSKTQEHAQKLINERQAQLAAQKVNTEEIDLERAALRAKIRNLEGELAGVGAQNRSLERENRQLRDIVETFIESKGQNDGETDFPMVDTAADMLSPSKKSAGALYDAGQAQLNVVCNLDADLNELLNNVLKEEDRQRYVLKEFSSLLDKNADMLGITSDVNARGESVVKPVMIDAGVQADDIIGRGAVKILEPDEDEALPKLPSRRPPAAPEVTPVVLGAEIPHLLRDMYTSFPAVLRIPPAHWTVKSLYAIYFAMIRQQDELALTEDGNVPTTAVCKPKVALWQYTYDFYVKQFHVPSIAEINLSRLLRACEHHRRYNKSVLVFALQMGLTSKERSPDYDPSDTDFILKVIRQLAGMGELIGDLSFENIDDSLTPMNQGGSVVSMSVAGKTPQFAMSQSLMSTGSNQKPSIRLSHANAPIAPGEFRTHIQRSSAVATTKAIFEKWFPDKGEDCAMKVEAMPSAKRDAKYVSIHDYMEITIDQWKGVRLVWLDHIHYLFNTYSCVYHAIQPLTYFNDQGSRSRDAVLVLTERSGPGEPKKRVVNWYERFVSAAKNNELPRRKDKSDNGVSGSFNRDWVYELLPKKVFASVLALLKPDITVEEVNDMYDEACKIQDELCKSKLNEIWKKFPTDYRAAAKRSDEDEIDTSNLPKHFYLNTTTGTPQWSTPYYANSYPSVDIEISAFERCVMSRDILEKCPLLEFFLMNPKDLWSNTDMFYRQIEQTRQKERRRQRHTSMMQRGVIGGPSTASGVADP